MNGNNSVPNKVSVQANLTPLFRQAVINDISTTSLYSKQKIGQVLEADLQAFITQLKQHGWACTIVTENQPGTGLTGQPQVRYLVVQ